jgi:hypothetical protein
VYSVKAGLPFNSGIRRGNLDKRLVLKWDLDHGVAMKGRATNKIRKLIAKLELEGRL